MNKIKNSVRRATKKFIKAIKGNLDFENIERYLDKSGYRVVFFETLDGDEEIRLYKLEKKAKNKKAFTYNGSAKIVFINNNLSSEDKKYLLYHETAHIFLGHLNYERLSTRNNMLLDIEADAFVYELLNPKKINAFMPLIFILTVLCSFTLGTCANSPVSDEYVPLQSYTKTYTVPQTLEDFVYITTTGTKSHDSRCIHIKNKDNARIDRIEAEKVFLACKMCNP